MCKLIPYMKILLDWGWQEAEQLKNRLTLNLKHISVAAKVINLGYYM